MKPNAACRVFLVKGNGDDDFSIRFIDDDSNVRLGNYFAAGGACSQASE